MSVSRIPLALALAAVLLVPGCGSDSDDGEDTTAVTTSGPAPAQGEPELSFYDWEPNVVGEDGRPGAEVTDPRGRIPSLYQATTRAAMAKPLAEKADRAPGSTGSLAEADRANDSGGAKYYVFGPDQELVSGPHPEEPDDVDSGSEVVKVPRGIVVIQDEKPENAGPETPDFYYVLEDDRELSIDDIENPEQNFDPVTEEPIVTFSFTDEGQKRFASLTRRVAARGAALPPTGGPPEPLFQQFAIVLDGQLLTLATVDFVENPGGISSAGTQINGVGSLQDTIDLAESLER